MANVRARYSQYMAAFWKADQQWRVAVADCNQLIDLCRAAPSREERRRIGALVGEQWRVVDVLRAKRAVCIAHINLLACAACDDIFGTPHNDVRCLQCVLNRKNAKTELNPTH